MGQDANIMVVIYILFLYNDNKCMVIRTRKLRKIRCMNQELEKLLLENGASMVGFASIDGLYSTVDLNGPRTEDSETEPYDIPHYPYGVSIVLSYPGDVIKNISAAPTMEYYDEYHRLNSKLNELAALCAEYIKEHGYHAYPQITSVMKEYGIFRTVMPHKTVAVKAGLGWIGKSALFITEKYGSAVRLTSVLTDSPLECNKSILLPKCGSCNRCTEACPGKAISGRIWSPELDRDDLFDALACRKKAREIAAEHLGKKITLCGKCIEVCPYTRGFTWKAGAAD
jgi:epoxyqueuosine reductase QueG